MSSALVEINRSRAQRWQLRPDPISVTALVKTLKVPDSENERGELSPYVKASHPGQSLAIDAYDGIYDPPGRRFRTFVFVGDAQGMGKSWLMQISLFHTAIEKGQSLIYALPTRDVGGDIWSLKIRKAVEQAGLGKYLPQHGPGSKSGSRPRFVQFRRIDGKGGGTLVFMAAGGRGQSGQAALTAKTLLVDEVEDWPPEALELIQNRVSRWNQVAQIIYACTINKNNAPDAAEDQSNILPIYQASIRGRVGYPCPHCGKVTRLLVDRFRYEGTTPAEWMASAHIGCEHCAAVITDAQREVMHASPSLVMESPEAEAWGLLCTALDCPWKSLAWLAGKAHAAKVALDAGNPEPMKQLHNKQWSQQWVQRRDEQSTDLTEDYLMRRSAASLWGPTVRDTDREGDDRSYSRHIAPVPEGAQWATVSIDVQGDRVYWLVMLGNLQDQTWDQAWGYEYFNTDRQEMTPAQLHAVLSRVDSVVRGIVGDLLWVGRGVDANFNTDAVIAWLKLHPEWYPLYGASARKAAKMARSGRKVKDHPGICFLRRPESSKDWPLKQDRFHVDTDPMRHAAQRTLLLKLGEPSAAHLPRGLTTSASDKNYIEHLCAEQWNPQTLAWFKPKGAGRHDYLDNRTYCMSLHRLHLLKASAPPPEDAPAPGPQGGGFLAGFTDSWTS